MREDKKTTVGVLKTAPLFVLSKFAQNVTFIFSAFTPQNEDKGEDDEDKGEYKVKMF